MKSKKADVNWIVVGFVLALIVLAILAYIFYAQTKLSSQTAAGITDCKARGGSCADKKNAGFVCFYGLGCKDTTPLCCIPETT